MVEPQLSFHAVGKQFFLDRHSKMRDFGSRRKVGKCPRLAKLILESTRFVKRSGKMTNSLKAITAVDQEILILLECTHFSHAGK